MYSYAVRHWHKPARPHIVNNNGYTPLTLATKLGRRQIFEEMLELMKVVGFSTFLKKTLYALFVHLKLIHNLCLVLSAPR